MESVANYIVSFVLLMIIFVRKSECVNDTDIKNIFILGGQSNMVGRGGAIKFYVWDGIVPAQCQPSPQIMRLNVNCTWEEAREPLHRDMENNTKAKGIGPGMPFAHFLLQNNSAFGPIGLVPCAFGDTSISEWSKGSELYNRMLARTQAALTLSGGTLRAILWYQGEKDTSVESAPLYKGMFQQFINDVRSDLQLPSLLFIEVALDADPVYGPNMVIRKAQLETAAEVPNVKCVDALGLPKEPRDGAHLTTDSQVRLGTNMAIAFLQ